MLEKVNPVIDTSYKPYVSDGNQEDDKEPEFYRTDEGQLVLKKVTAFYTKVPCRVLRRGTDTQRGILTLGLDLYQVLVR
ncbi:hypothetical protein DSO57_1013989 [Entomophthora muscae]|uniref:Uncharacterized protein n=1 Tax=Entomophthora muscae TaxID=34485 RepID=A0ACC2TSI5_9FUNG|nr:hypothetical protein DSO57_1013989 [Entomophthora muscae]